MNGIMGDILSAVGTAILIGIGASIYRLATRASRLPKRMARVENVTPMLIRGQVTTMDILVLILKCVQGKKSNGDLEKAEEEVRTMKEAHMKFLSEASISQRAAS